MGYPCHATCLYGATGLGSGGVPMHPPSRPAVQYKPPGTAHLEELGLQCIAGVVAALLLPCDVFKSGSGGARQDSHHAGLLRQVCSSRSGAAEAGGSRAWAFEGYPPHFSTTAGWRNNEHPSAWRRLLPRRCRAAGRDSAGRCRRTCHAHGVRLAAGCLAIGQQRGIEAFQKAADQGADAFVHLHHGM